MKHLSCSALIAHDGTQWACPSRKPPSRVAIAAEEPITVGDGGGNLIDFQAYVLLCQYKQRQHEEKWQ